MNSSPAPMAQDPAELVNRIRAGEPGAEEELVRRYSRGITVILRRATSEASLVNDLHQETFYIALTRIRRGSLRDPSRLSGFIAGLAANLATQHFRRQPARTEQADSAALELVSNPAPVALEQLEEHQRANLARKILEEMSTDRDRQLLRRFYLSGDDKEEICADLGLSSLQFNRVLFRARQRYRELYERAVNRQ